MMNSKVVLVTGAAKRIGASIVRTFHANGYRVLIHARSSKNEAIALRSIRYKKIQQVLFTLISTLISKHRNYQ